MATAHRPPQHEPLSRASGAQTQQNGQTVEQDQLPLSTWLANRFLAHPGPCSRLLSPASSSPSLSSAPARWLSYVIIKELGHWESLFMRSSLYRTMNYVSLSRWSFSSKGKNKAPSPFPFIVTIVVCVVQLKVLWTHQRRFLVELLVALGPLMKTLSLALKISESNPPGSHDRIEGQDRAEVLRWLVYWAIYSSLTGVESWRSGHSSAGPNIPVDDMSSRATGNLSGPSRSWSALRTRMLTKIQGPPGNGPSRPSQTSHPHVGQGSAVRSLFKDHIPSGQHHALYDLIKVCFMNWCSGDRTNGYLKLWSQLKYLVLFKDLVICSQDSSRKTRRVVKLKVVSQVDNEEEVTCAQNKAFIMHPFNKPPESDGLGSMRLGPRSKVSCDLTAPDESRPISEEGQNTVGTMTTKTEPMEAWPIRRVQSDPIPCSPSCGCPSTRPLVPDDSQAKKTLMGPGDPLDNCYSLAAVNHHPHALGSISSIDESEMFGGTRKPGHSLTPSVEKNAWETSSTVAITSS